MSHLIQALADAVMAHYTMPQFLRAVLAAGMASLVYVLLTSLVASLLGMLTHAYTVPSTSTHWIVMVLWTIVYWLLVICNWDRIG